VLLERRKEVESQLQFRQRELRFLQRLQGQQREREEEVEGEGRAESSLNVQRCRSEAAAGSAEGGAGGVEVCKRRRPTV